LNRRNRVLDGLHEDFAGLAHIVDLELIFEQEAL
jgi:hypothetical protein